MFQYWFILQNEWHTFFHTLKNSIIYELICPLIHLSYPIFVLCLNRDIVIFRNKVGLHDLRYPSEAPVSAAEIFRPPGNSTCWCLIGGECWWNFPGVGRSLSHAESRPEKNYKTLQLKSIKIIQHHSFVFKNTAY